MFWVWIEELGGKGVDGLSFFFLFFLDIKGVGSLPGAEIRSVRRRGGLIVSVLFALGFCLGLG